MSHAADWRCRSQACRALLGRVRDGVLYPLVPVRFIDARGVIRLRVETLHHLLDGAKLHTLVPPRHRVHRLLLLQHLPLAAASPPAGSV